MSYSFVSTSLSQVKLCIGLKQYQLYYSIGQIYIYIYTHTRVGPEGTKLVFMSMDHI